MNDNFYMREAIVAASFSLDPSVQNGAIIVTDTGEIVGTGFNAFPEGVDDSLPSRWERPGKYMWIEHAERNAVFCAARLGNATEGAVMYCPWASCADCARALVQAGLSKLVRFPMPPADGWNESIQTGDVILQEGGVEIVEIPLDGVGVPEGLRLGQFREA